MKAKAKSTSFYYNQLNNIKCKKGRVMLNRSNDPNYKLGSKASRDLMEQSFD